MKAVFFSYLISDECSLFNYFILIVLSLLLVFHFCLTMWSYFMNTRHFQCERQIMQPFQLSPLAVIFLLANPITPPLISPNSEAELKGRNSLSSYYHPNCLSNIILIALCLLCVQSSTETNPNITPSPSEHIWKQRTEIPSCQWAQWLILASGSSLPFYTWLQCHCASSQCHCYLLLSCFHVKYLAQFKTKSIPCEVKWSLETSRPSLLEKIQNVN